MNVFNSPPLIPQPTSVWLLIPVSSDDAFETRGKDPAHAFLSGVEADKARAALGGNWRTLRLPISTIGKVEVDCILLPSCGDDDD